MALALMAASLLLTACGGSGSKTATARSRPVTISIEIKEGKPVGGIKRATVHKGQQVSLVVHSDVADEVHLHGYDLHSDVKAGGGAGIHFTASVSGVFEAELESRGLQILELTVK
jgi:hypothetical protein